MGASAADLLEQGHHGGQSPDVLDLVPIRVVNAPELSQQAQQLRVQKPLRSPGEEKGNRAAESLVSRPRSPDLPLSEAMCECQRKSCCGMANLLTVLQVPTAASA